MTMMWDLPLCLATIVRTARHGIRASGLHLEEPYNHLGIDLRRAGSLALPVAAASLRFVKPRRARAYKHRRSYMRCPPSWRRIPKLTFRFRREGARRSGLGTTDTCGRFYSMRPARARGAGMVCKGVAGLPARFTGRTRPFRVLSMSCGVSINCAESKIAPSGMTVQGRARTGKTPFGRRISAPIFVGLPQFRLHGIAGSGR